MKIAYRTLLAPLLLAVCAPALVAASSPALTAPVSVKLTADKKVVSGKSGDTSWVSVETPGVSVAPGDVLRYAIVGANHLTHAIHAFVLTQPIPHGSEYVEGTASVVSGGDAVVTASADGGATFAAKPTIEVRDADGKTHTEVAPPFRYTHVRWTFRGDFAASSSLAVRCEVRVR